jgi:hypothetical protein
MVSLFLNEYAHSLCWGWSLVLGSDQEWRGEREEKGIAASISHHMAILATPPLSEQTASTAWPEIETHKPTAFSARPCGGFEAEPAQGPSHVDLSVCLV